MEKISQTGHHLLLVLTVFIFTITSCSSIKNVKYFTDIPDSGKITKVNQTPFIEPTIQPDDILSINIQVIDPEATRTLNNGNIQSSAVGNTTAGSTGGQTVTGLLVDKSGNIEYPVLGKIHVAGLTTNGARELIRQRASDEGYRNPAVNLRFANFKITILGEVAKPGTYVVSTEKVNILDALGLAGDLTIYGKRENVLLIRQNEDGSQDRIRLDLTKSSTLTSPYFYLRQNDYIYVEALKTKVVASDAIQNRNITITTTVISFLVSVIVVIIAKK